MTFNPSIANITQQYRNLIGKPYITVSAKGISNGLSNTYNDGADFGPDTTLGATSPDQVGPPYTQTTGIMEVHAYAQTHLGTKVKFIGGSNNTSYVGWTFYIDVPLQIGQTDHEQIIWEFEGYCGITISDKFPSGQPMFIIGNSNNPSIDLEMHGNRMYFYGTSPSGNSTASTWISFEGLNPGGNWLIFDFGIANVGAFSNSPLYNTSIINSANLPVVYMRGFEMGSLYNTGLCGFDFIDSSLAYISSNPPSGGAAFIYLIRAFRPTAITLQSSGGENILVFDNSGVAGGSNQPLITASGYSTESPANIFIYGDSSFLQNSAGYPIFSLGNYVNVYAETPRFTYNASSGTCNIVDFTGTTGTTVRLGKIRMRSLTSGGLFSIWGSTASSYVTEIEEAIVEQSTGTVQTYLVNSTAGTTAGTVTGQIVQHTPNFKRAVFTFDGYENDTTTDQTIDFPIQFSSYAAIVANTTGLTISVTAGSSSYLTVTAPDSTTTYSGIVIVEGY